MAEEIAAIEKFVQIPPSRWTINAITATGPSKAQSVIRALFIEAGTLENLYPIAGVKIGALYILVPGILSGIEEHIKNRRMNETSNPINMWTDRHSEGLDYSQQAITFAERQIRFDRLADIWGNPQSEPSGFKVIDALINPQTHSILNPYGEVMKNIDPSYFHIVELGAKRYKKLYIATFGEPKNNTRVAG